MFRFAGLSATFGVAIAAHQSCDSAQPAYNGLNTNGTMFKNTFTTDNSSAACNPYPLYRQLYFSYTPTCSGWGRMKTDVTNNPNTTDKVLSAANGTCGTLTRIPLVTGTTNPSTGTKAAGCFDDGGSGETIMFQTLMGSELKLVVGQYSDVNLTQGYGYFDFELNCASAGEATAATAAIVEDGVTISRSNYGSVNTVVMPGASSGYQYSWFKYVAPCTGNATVKIDSWVNADMYAGVYTSTSATYGYTSDSDTFDIWTQTSASAVAKKGVVGGTSYWIAIGTYSASGEQAPYSVTVGPCTGTPGGASSASALAVPVFALVALFAAQ